MRIHEMRAYLIGLYPKSWHWREKVNGMADNQIVAVMMRLKLQNKKTRKTP